MYVIYIYKTASRFTSARKYKLIKLLKFIFARRYSPSEKQPINLFTQFWKISDFKPIIKKIDVTLILSIIAKEKSDRIAKSEKLFWFHTTLIAFVIVYIISMMNTGFLKANTCVHKKHVYLKREQKNYSRAIVKLINELCVTVVGLKLSKFLTIDFNKQK